MRERKSRLKICFVCSSFYPAVVYGGPSFSNYLLAQKLSEKNVEVQVSTTNANGPQRLTIDTQNNQCFSPSFSIRYFNETIIGRLSFPLIFGLKKYAKEADVIHVTDIFSTSYLIALFHALRMQKTIVVSTRGVLAPWGRTRRIQMKNIWMKVFIKPYLSKLHFHATSEKEKKDILSLFPKAKVFIVPNGIITIDDKTVQSYQEKFPDWLQKKGIPYSPNALYISSMGRLHKKKGFDILIEAFAKLQEQFNELYLLIAGNDEGEWVRLNNRIEELYLKNKIHLLGQVDGEAKNIFLSGSHLFVLPSHDENFGNVYLEALHLGTPIIASKNTPWQQVEANECGLWIENTVPLVAQGMAQLLKSDLAKASKNASVFAQQFDLEKTAEKMKTIYHHIV